MTLDNNESAMLVLLDFSAAFDTIDHILKTAISPSVLKASLTVSAFETQSTSGIAVRPCVIHAIHSAKWSIMSSLTSCVSVVCLGHTTLCSLEVRPHRTPAAPAR